VYDSEKNKTMGFQRQNRFHAFPCRPVHQERPNHARALSSKKVSPKGPGPGMRMLTYFINRAGRGLSTQRRKELEKAKILLSNRIQKAKKSEAKRAA
jgi:hypothetical protein